MPTGLPEFNTFSILGRCERTGMLGIGIATHAHAVGSRCPFVRSRIGAVATQALTDPRLGPLALDLLQRGLAAAKVVQEIAAGDDNRDYHQIGVVDRAGGSAARTGSSTKPWAGHLAGPGYVAMGNFLIGEEVVDAMASSFTEDASRDLDERLLRAIERGRDAGGQHGGQRSAALVVFDREVFPWIDIRVDAHDEPIAELRRIFGIVSPQKEFFTRRARTPTLPEPPEHAVT